MYITPIAVIPFAMSIFLLNLFVVLITTLTVVVIFKIELTESREKLFEKNKEMTDSINYAKKIQHTLLAHADFLVEHLPEHFVLFKPKDIVSGDFYWATEHNNKFYLAVCDSTGHGVPGAFMCLLNIGFLSEAIKEKNIEKPNEIFTYVRKRLIESISKEGQQDGMDGILVCFETLFNGETKITYSGANNAPVLIQRNEIQILKTDKMPVGKGQKEEPFNLYDIHAEKGDVLYLYTDGYADQFGGEKGKKYKYKPLNAALLSMHNLPLSEQFEVLNNTFENWRGDLEQVDDVAVIGIKL
jgi:serine phosphatase RsbU (regulator of sigma subunit)